MFFKVLKIDFLFFRLLLVEVSDKYAKKTNKQF